MKARKKKETLLLDDFFRQQIAHLDENENHFTAANYRNARQWVSDYVVYMQDTDKLSASSADCYYRILRAVYNKAVKQSRVEEAEEYPFKSINIAVPSTLKRALSEIEVCRLRDAKLTGEKARARDVFMFLFYARGMCFVDLFKLKKSDLYGGYINYSRSKTAMPACKDHPRTARADRPLR